MALSKSRDDGKDTDYEKENGCIVVIQQGSAYQSCDDQDEHFRSFLT